MNMVMVPPPFSISNGLVVGGGISASLYNLNPDVVVHTTGPTEMTSYGSVHSLATYDSFHYDPLSDYKSWYGVDQNGPKVDLMEDVILSKVWEHVELNNWLVSNIQDVILVQRLWPMWRICFKSEADYTKFLSWWSNQEKQEQMFIPVPAEYQGKNYAFLQELKHWCDLNLADKFELTNFSERIKCAIRDPQEAVLFRLSWSEPTNPQL